MNKTIEEWTKDLEQLITLTIGQVFVLDDLILPVKKIILQYYDEGLDSYIVVQRIFNILLNTYCKDKQCEQQFESIN